MSIAHIVERGWIGTMSDLFGVFALGIVVGMSIIRFGDLFFKIREEDKQWKEIVKDWRKDE